MVFGSGMCAKRVVVDGRHHMLGRLAFVLAKELLNGQRVVVVRCEEICLSGGLVRQKMKYMQFLRNRNCRNRPATGPKSEPPPCGSGSGSYMAMNRNRRFLNRGHV